MTQHKKEEARQMSSQKGQKSCGGCLKTGVRQTSHPRDSTEVQCREIIARFLYRQNSTEFFLQGSSSELFHWANSSEFCFEKTEQSSVEAMDVGGSGDSHPWEERVQEADQSAKRRRGNSGGGCPSDPLDYQIFCKGHSFPDSQPSD